MNLFDISLQLNGFPLRKAQQTLAEIQQKNQVEYQQYLEQKKQDIVNYHLEHNSFYKSFAKNANPKDWNSIPVMTKHDLQQPLHRRLSEGFNTKNVYVNKTSGSSGDPFIFAKDKFCHALTWAIIKNRFAWHDIDFNRSYQARFYGIPLDKKGYYKEKFKDLLSNRFRFSIFDLSDSQFEKNLIVFKHKAFDYINGYTSSIVQFAKFLKRKNIILKDVCPTLKTCIVTSEMLFEDDKKLLEYQFGIPVINEYGASELDLIAFQKPNNEWLVNSETLFVEVLDDQNNPVPNGKEGRLVITSLYNKAESFIRYDIGDLGVLSTKSSLQFPILDKLIGRTNDIAVLPSGKKAAGLTFYYITKSIIEDNGTVKEFIIEQKALDAFTITYVCTEDLTQTKKALIANAIEDYLESGLSVIFERKDKLIRSKSGKLKQFSSLLSGFYN